LKSFVASVAVVALALLGFASASSGSGSASASAWKLKWSTDFPTSAKLGQFSGCNNDVESPNAYCSNLPPSLRSQWWAYPYPWPDTATERNYPLGGYYDPANTVWISGGQMHIRLFRTTSWVHSAAVVPKAADGVKYGEFIETFSVSQAAPGYKAAHLLWPTNSNQNHEIDFPENVLGTSVCGYVHSIDQVDQATFCPDMTWTGWHTSEIQWAPGSLTFYLDGKQIGHVTGNWVPDEDMAWIIQNETALTGPPAPPNSSAQINISHVAVYSYTG
jgi:hypothetical protein